jgi:hypothetical protein
MRAVQPLPSSSKKHVDFTSSTKARYDVKEASSTPTKSLTPPSHGKIKITTESVEIDYPTLPTPSAMISPTEAAEALHVRYASPSPQKRRQSNAPGDFTFRADSNGIVFGQSPNAPASSARDKRPSIRHVSAEPAIIPQSFVEPPPTVQGSKKRKFEFENDISIQGVTLENKENIGEAHQGTAPDEDRPAKRAKAIPSEASTVKLGEISMSPGKRQTLGVKPKGAKPAPTKNAGKGKPSTISRERLNALSMPKKRA